MIYDIVGGPSKFDLMVGLFDTPRSQRHLLEFTIAPQEKREIGSIKVRMRKKLELFINTVQRENGSGESWNLTGYDPETTAHTTFHYDTRNRTGTIELRN